ncbi:MAG: ABC transporter permease [Chloroflexota bacterium]
MTMVRTTFNETRKGLIILWDYKFSMFTQLLGIFFVFIGIMFFVGQGSITQEQVASTVIGFIITFYAMETVSNMSWALQNEAQVGTLEQMYMSPAPTPLVILGRSFASLVSGTVEMVIVVIATMLLFQVTLPFSWAVIPILLITLVGLLGFGYLIGGLTLIFKQIGPIANLMQNFLLIGNGTFLPVSMMPAWLSAISLTLPSTYGIVLMRRIMLDGETFMMLVRDGSIMWLGVQSVAYFIAGWLIYKFCERIARNQGTLGQY